MPQKMSPNKVSRMLALYFDGYSQSEIAGKLKIDQSTVSLHVGKLKHSVEQQGIKAAAEEVGIMDQVEALHSLSVELKKAKLTAEEAKVGLKMELLLQELGIKPEGYKDVIQVCTKVKAEGILPWAVKLNKLEQSSGMTYEEIVAHCASTYGELEKAQQDLEAVTGKLGASKQELAGIENQKEMASQDLKAHMQQVGVDMSRLKQVEGLAQALKQGGVSNEDLQGYIERQQFLNKAGMSMDTFASILEKAKVATTEDHGTELLGRLSAYGGLSKTIKALEGKAELLTKQVQGLDETAKVKGQLDAETVKLKAERASLQGNVAQLHVQKAELEKIRGEAASVAEQKSKLDGQVAELETRKAQLSDEIKSREEKIGNLAELQAKHAGLTAAVGGMKAQLEKDKSRLDVFESFLGLVQSSSPSIAELEKFAGLLPGLIDHVKQGKYSADLLRGEILRNLGGDKLQSLGCISCQARFYIDKPAPIGGYQCPIGGFAHKVVVDQDAAAVLKAALSAPKRDKHPAVKVVNLPIAEEPKPQDGGKT